MLKAAIPISTKKKFADMVPLTEGKTTFMPAAKHAINK